jgi:hypothetical protein
MLHNNNIIPQQIAPLLFQQNLQRVLLMTRYSKPAENQSPPAALSLQTKRGERFLFDCYLSKNASFFVHQIF